MKFDKDSLRLLCMIMELGLLLEAYEWYLDIRRYRTVKHGGFGLGFERIVLFTTWMQNIRAGIRLSK